MNKESPLSGGKLILAAICLAALYLLLVVIIDVIIDVEEPVDTPRISLEFQSHGENDTAILITNVTPAPVSINDTSLHITNAYMEASGSFPPPRDRRPGRSRLAHPRRTSRRSPVT